MQVNRESDFKDRTLFYWAKLYSEELKTGDEYGELKQTICINIINFDLFACEDYHSSFKIMESERRELLTDKFAIHFFELKKLSKFKRNRRMEDWLNLINAETEDELMSIQQTTIIPEIKDTIVMLREFSADEKVRTEAFYREKRLHDEASALGSARSEGVEQGRAEGRAEGIAEGRAQERSSIIERMRNNGFTEEQIQKIIGE